jgi:glutamate synthase (NADPH/NADH) large chain
MSGGIAYVYDPEKKFERLVNTEMIDLDTMDDDDYNRVQTMVRNHLSYTGSKVALDVLNGWEECKGHFVKVMPRDYKAVLVKRNEKPKLNVKVAEVMD